MSNKRMLKIVSLAVPLILLVFIVIVAARPSEFHVSRSVVIAAPPEAIFPHVNELKKWEAWNPWGKIDPDIKMTYAGPASGVGASYTWVGNQKVGQGKATITETRGSERVALRLEFYKPMAGVSTAEFAFTPQGSQTQVTWAMSGKNNFIAKAFRLFMSMDTMIGSQFERGLADLKAVAESVDRKSARL